METLRSAAYCASIDEAGYSIIKRYYCQLHSLQNRFPLDSDPNVTTFFWRDVYSNNVTQSTDLRHEMAVVLYNYGSLHTQLAASAARETEDEMKLACTHFQRAAWAYETIRAKYPFAATGDLYPELLLFMQNICFAQAQECILEKSLIDNRKAIIVAKVTSQIIDYYNSAFAALLSGGEEGAIAEIVGSKLFREWRQYIQFKVQYMSCILLLYQGQHAEELQKMGERVTLYQAAYNRLEEAHKETKNLSNQTQVDDALAFVMDVVEAKRKAAKNENEFIYHEEVPDLSTISTIAGANLVKGIPLNVADASIATEDIFRRLIPIKAHEHSSLYSEEKANLLRKITQKIESKDLELNKFMESLSIDTLNYDVSNVTLPQPLIDRCADLNARPNAIPELISKMASLAEICVDVENTLHVIQELLNEEESFEKDYQQTMGYRPGGHFIELKREFMKYQEAHSKAGDSNETLRKAMEQHVNNLKILSKSLAELQAAVPTCSIEINPKHSSDTQMLLNKVNEMCVQRGQLYATLNENIQKDDITAQLIVCGDKDVEKVMKTEMEKHEKLVNIIEQNLVAQGNILKSFTDAYAKCADIIKAVYEIKHKREIFFSSLINSYDVYSDLLGKSLKGLEFYKKLQNNIHKLAARVRSARDVQDEERQQRIESMNKKAQAPASNVPSMHANQPPVTTPSMPIQYPTTDYSASVAPAAPTSMIPSDTDHYDKYHSTAIRPTPIGQENTAIQPACITSMNYDYSHAVASMASAEIPFSYPTSSSGTYNTPKSQTNTPHSLAHFPSSQATQQYYSNSQATNPYLNASNSQVSYPYVNTNLPNPSYISSASPSMAMTRSYGNEKPAPNNTAHALHSTANVSNAPSITSHQSPYSSYAMPSATHTMQNVSQPQNYNYPQNVGSSRSNSYSNSPYMPASSTSMYYPVSTSTAANMIHSPQLPPSSQPIQTPHLTQPLQMPQSAQSPQPPSYSHMPEASSASQQYQTLPSHSMNVYNDGRISTPHTMQQSSSIGQYSIQNQSSAQNFPNTSTQYSQPANNMGYGQYPTQSAQQNPINPYGQTSNYAKTNLNDAYYNAATSGQSQQTSNQYYSNNTTTQYNHYNTADNNALMYSTDAPGIPYDQNYMMPSQHNAMHSQLTSTVQTNIPSNVSANAMANVQQPAPNAFAPYQQQTNVPVSAVPNNYPPANLAAPAPVASTQTLKAADKPSAAKFDLLSELENVPIPAPTLQPTKFDSKPEVNVAKVYAPAAVISNK